jgi:GNAT superfamily N-acetyltransferase
VAERGYIARVSEELVAFGLVGNYKYVDEPTRYFARVRVIPSHRRRGIGTALVSLLEEWVTPRMPECLFTATELDDEASERFARS